MLIVLAVPSHKISGSRECETFSRDKIRPPNFSLHLCKLISRLCSRNRNSKKDFPPIFPLAPSFILHPPAFFPSPLMLSVNLVGFQSKVKRARELERRKGFALSLLFSPSQNFKPFKNSVGVFLTSCDVQCVWS